MSGGKTPWRLNPAPGGSFEKGGNGMSHDCRAMLCESPHYEECSCDVCEFCHEGHSKNGGWRETWNIYPECSQCEDEMLEEVGQILMDYQGEDYERNAISTI
jgi:hypothetical protein